MKAIGYQDNLPIQDDNALQDITLEMPTPSGHDVLVAVKAISVNPVDYKIRQNRPAPEGEYAVIGWDAAGVVTAVGDAVREFAVGDKVYYAGDLNRSGSNAEYQLVDARIVGRMPESLDFAEAAALPLTALTAWELAFDRLEIPTDDKSIGLSVLVVGAAGGVGSILTQLLKARSQVTVIGTASRPASVQWLQSLGADHVIDHNLSLSEELARLGIEAVDYVVSLNNTQEHLPEIVNSLKPQGKLGMIDDPSRFDIMALKTKSISLHWEFMYTRSMYQTPDMSAQGALLNDVAKLVDAGEVKSTVAHHLGRINAENLRRAHAMLENREAHGKIVLADF